MLNIATEPQIKQIPIGPVRPYAAQNGGVPAELLAVTGARFSRSLQSFDEILSPYADSLDTSEGINQATKSVFAHLDYGHNSIIDMVPIAFELRGITQFAAMVLWYVAPRAVGQESSTRYIDFQNQPLRPITAFTNTKDNSVWEDWAAKQMTTYLQATEVAFRAYETLLEDDPSLTSDNGSFYSKTITLSIDMHGNVRDASTLGYTRVHSADLFGMLWSIPVTPITETNPKKRARLIRNTIFDSLRKLLPVTITTNVYMQLPLRDWLDVIALFAGSPCAEFRLIAEGLKQELLSGEQALNDTTLMRYSETSKEHTAWWLDFFYNPDNQFRYEAKVFHDTLDTDYVTGNTLPPTTRYSPANRALERALVRYTIPTNIGALRDMNRHRKGIRDITLDTRRESFPLFVQDTFWREEDLIYRLNYLTLGSRASWTHATSLAHLGYIVNLRTGVGSHTDYKTAYNKVSSMVCEGLGGYPDIEGLYRRLTTNGHK